MDDVPIPVRHDPQTAIRFETIQHADVSEDRIIKGMVAIWLAMSMGTSA
jgi:hypothetical protein